MIGATGMVLVPFGVHLSRIIPNAPLLVGFAFVLAWVSWRMFRQTRDAAKAVNAMRTTVPCVVDPDRGRLIWTMPCAWALASTGALSGFLSGLLGVGGGFVIVPSLNKYTKLAARSIVATSLAAIALVSVSGVASAAIQGSVEWVIAIPFACGAIPALIVGRQIAARIAGARMQQAFAVTGAAVSLLLMARGLGLMSG